MEQAYNPSNRKQVIVMRRNITITTYNYKVKLVFSSKRIYVRRDR